MKHLFLIIITFYSSLLFAQFGLKKASETDFTSGVCSSCITTINSIPGAVRWYFTEKNNTIYFEITDATYLEKLFPNSIDALAADIVLRNQYSCGKIVKPELSSIKRGKLLEPVSYSSFSKNITVDESTGIASFPVSKIPDEFLGQDYEVNMLLIKEDKVCRINSFFGIPSARWELLEMGLFMDTSLVETKTITTTKTTFKDYKKDLRFTIPFEKNKYEYKPEDVKPLYDSLRLTDYQIKTIDIHAYSSIEGTTENNINLQNKRANSIVKALSSFQSEEIKTAVSASENWIEFLDDMDLIFP